MIRRRHFTPQLRRRLDELDAKPGLGDEAMETQAERARRRLDITDQTSPQWRALLNDFPHQAVAQMAALFGNNPEKARQVLEQRFGKPLL